MSVTRSPVMPPSGSPSYSPDDAPVYRGGGGFNPLVDVPGLAFYHELQTADAAYETLPGNTLATAQNDGIGAVLDLKRYKERGAEAFSDFDVYGSGWSKSGTSWIHAATAGDDAFVTATAVNDLVVGKVYEIQFTVVAYSAEAGGGGGVGVSSDTSGTAKLYSAAGTHTFLFKAASTDLIFTIRNSASTEVTGITVREIPGFHATQDVAANQPVLNIEGGIRSALFGGAGHRLSIPNSKGAVNFLHDGTGGNVLTCLRVSDLSAVQYVFGNASTSEVGVFCAITTNGSIQLFVSDGAAITLSALSPAGTVVAGEKAAFRFAVDSEGARIYKNSVLAVTSTPSGTFPSGNASREFTAGHYNPGSGTFKGDMYTLPFAIQGALTDYQAQRLATYMLRRAGA